MDLNFNKEVRMTSKELCGLINKFRKEEGNTVEKAHPDFMKSIRKEIKVLESVGITNEGNISLVEYIDTKGEKRPCYSLNKFGIMQMLNKESAIVRYKTQKYIESLEYQVSELDMLILKSLDPNLSKDERIEIERRRAELSRERDKQAKWFTDFMDSKGLFTSTQMGKLFKIGSGQKMNKILNEHKICFKQGNNWLPYKDVNESWYKVITGTKKEHGFTQLKFTPKGIIEISKILNIDITEDDINNIA